MAANGEELRLLNEIAGKLDYALKVASQGGAGDAPAPMGTGGVSPEVVRQIARIWVAQGQPEILEAALDAVIGATLAERAYVMLLEEGRKLRFKAGRAIDQETAQGEANTSKTIIKRVITAGESVLIGDTSKSDVTSSSIRGMNMRSIVGVPLLTNAGRDGAEQKVMGVLYLDSRVTVKELTQADLEAAGALAAICAVALERDANGGGGGGGGGDGGASSTAAKAEAAKIKHNMQRLVEVSRAIGSILVLDDLLVLIMEKVLEVTKADRGFIMLLEEKKPVFKIGRAWNKKEGAAKRTFKLDETQFFFSRTIINRALEQGQSVCVKDAVHGGDGEEASVSMVQMELASVMATPLRESGNTLGLLYVDSKAANREFDDSDLELFEALAGQAAIGIKNALLVSQVKQAARLEGEIQIAAQMQQDMCPRVIPQIAGLDLAGCMVPAKEVGGDYYDFVEDAAAPQSLGIVVGDVSGKGLGSGIVAVMARCFLRSMMTAYGTESPSTLLNYLNVTLAAELKPGMFMTMLLLVWDPARKAVRWASSGHENLIVWRARSRAPEAIKSGGTPLGISASKGGPTADAVIQLNVGDALVLYSDGVTEAMNENSDEFTLERVLEVVRAHGHLPAKQIIEALDKATAAFRGKADQSDDITLVVLRRTG